MILKKSGSLGFCKLFFIRMKLFHTLCLGIVKFHGQRENREIAHLT